MPAARPLCCQILLSTLQLAVGCAGGSQEPGMDGRSAAKDPVAPTRELQAESDAHATLEPERNIQLTDAAGPPLQITDLPGAEELEVRSPDGRWVAYVAGATGITSVWVSPVPPAGAPPARPIQLTNVGLERIPRTPGQPPPGFVPPPDAGGLHWDGNEALSWSAEGERFRVELPR